MGFDYTIQYCKGKENQGADALSPVAAFHFHALLLPIADWWKTLQQEVLQQPYYNYFLTNQSLNCVQRDGIWTSLLPTVLTDGHSSSSGVHFGYLKTFTRISASFVWPGIHTLLKFLFGTVKCVNVASMRPFDPAGLL